MAVGNLTKDSHACHGTHTSVDARVNYGRVR